MKLPDYIVYDLLRVLLGLAWEHHNVSEASRRNFWTNLSRSANQAISAGHVLMRRGDWIPGGAHAYQNLRQDSTLTWERLQELIQGICAELEDSGRGQYDASLVDLVAQFLKTSRYQANQLSGEALQGLRKAILIPGELGELRQKLEETFNCARCGKSLKGFRPLVTLDTGGDSKGPELRCLNCMMPATVPCGHAECNEHVNLTEGDITALLGMTSRRCPEHGGERPAEPERPQQSRRQEQRQRRSLSDVIRGIQASAPRQTVVRIAEDLPTWALDPEGPSETPR